MDSNFNNGFQPLTNDEDVLLFGENTFTVGLLTELISEKVEEKIYHYHPDQKNYKGFTILDRINTGFSVGQKVDFKLSKSQWKFCTKEVDCQLLGVGYSGWKKGKLRIKTDVNLCPQNYYQSYANSLTRHQTIIKVELEFSPDEPNEYQSPLDKLRQLESDLS